MRIHKNDLVQIISGRERGKTGKVLLVSPKKDAAKVEKLNLVKRHVRPDQKNPQGGTKEKEAWIHLSNLQPVCPKTNQGTRIRMKEVKGKKVRVSVRSGEVVDKK
ncbi:MAG: 50S ribosomal protein L24 [Deltaproteobacteria bacterium]|nr:50S ribosomal protein L24 [Deltaproteobacteria bacterium]